MTSRAQSKSKKSQSTRPIAAPAELLAAAETAPSIFNIAAYFTSIYLMREKGYSWRQLEAWLEKFGIEISAVHLRRLYVSEDARLTELSTAELSALGCPQHMIDHYLSKQDPAQRLTAADPEGGKTI